LKWPYNNPQCLARLPYDEVATQLPEETSEADTLIDEALVALTLLIAESAPKDKDTIVCLAAYLLQERNSESQEKTP
jgi:hypothetical protein